MSKLDKIQTGKFEQFKCKCGNIYDTFEEANSCEHDFYDKDNKEVRK